MTHGQLVLISIPRWRHRECSAPVVCINSSAGRPGFIFGPSIQPVPRIWSRGYRSRARSDSLVEWFSKSSDTDLQHTPSHDRWLEDTMVVWSDPPEEIDQASIADLTYLLSSESLSRSGRNPKDACFEVQSASGRCQIASVTALRISRPPYLTGKDAWFHRFSFKSMFNVIDIVSRIKLSIQPNSSGFPEHGAVRIRYTIVVALQWRNEEERGNHGKAWKRGVSCCVALCYYDCFSEKPKLSNVELGW